MPKLIARPASTSTTKRKTARPSLPQKPKNTAVALVRSTRQSSTAPRSSRSQSGSSEFEDALALIRAVSRSRAIIEFSITGETLSANANFLKIFGYTLEEVQGMPYTFFLSPADRESKETRELWDGLARGEFYSGIYRHLGKAGNTIWLQTTINPVFDEQHRPYKVAYFASDVSATKESGADYQSQLEALDKSQALIDFNIDGIILHANQNFLNLMGYSLEEIKGKHHSMFLDPHQRDTQAYRDFWTQLRNGQFWFGEAKRRHKAGRDIYLNATYNPVFDLNGRVYKVLKTGTDITEQVRVRTEAQAAEAREKQETQERQIKINNLLEVVAAAAEGDLTREITVSGTDVAGQMAEGLGRLLADLRKSIASIGHTATSVASSSHELSSISQQLSSSSQSEAQQANGVSSASEQVSSNVSIVASSADEMLASIREISKSASEAARVAKSAVTLANATTQTISKLGISSQEIGKVIKVITSIAQQTNLLALNATIEAARAGEAGKGFAVVANEVKELAKETAHATEEISQKIESIQSDTKAAITAIADVSEIINQVNDISGTIASAVEEQTATTNEIGRNVSDAARGTRDIAQNIRHLATSAGETTAAARGIQEAAQSLTEMSSELAILVNRFRL
jgi:methyl-accepting chemotaxis protein